MKAKLFFIAAIITLACGSVSAQSVTLSPKTVTYKRLKPIMDNKKTFTITYPGVKAATPAISKRINAILSYEKAFAFTIAEEKTERQWLEEATYEVDYNANKILSITLTVSGTGAYPSSSTRYFVIHTAAGSRVTPATVFNNTAGLLAKIKGLRDAEVKKTIEDMKNDPETKDEDLTGFFDSDAKYNKVTLAQMTIDENGVVFHHNYGFPHVAQAYQPTGDFFLTWKELKPYIKKGGLLAQFIR